MKRKHPSNLFDDVCGQSYSGPTRVKLFNSAKNSLSLVQRLSLMKILPVHNGCVNSISWNETGEYLLSGSDDQHIVVTHGHTYKVLTDFKTTHRANIFSAKFMPGGKDNQIVSCAGDGIILFTDLNRQSETSRNHFNCHSGTTYEVITVPSDPHSFLSCGEDGTVRWFDLRQKNKCMKSQCKEDILISCQRAVTTLSINAMAPYQLAIGCSDSRVRLFDRRMLGTTASGHTTERDSLRPVCAFTAPQLEGQAYRITSLNFSPEGEELLVSFSSDHLYLFNIMDQGTARLSVDDPLNPDASGGDATRHKHPSPPVRRLRLRGDWSDTGPDARPEREGGRSSNTSELSQPRATVHATLMQRMTDVLSRMLNDPATRAALNGTGEHALTTEDERRTLNFPPEQAGSAPPSTDETPSQDLNDTLPDDRDTLSANENAVSSDESSTSPNGSALSSALDESVSPENRYRSSEGDVFPSTSSGRPSTSRGTRYRVGTGSPGFSNSMGFLSEAEIEVPYESSRWDDLDAEGEDDSDVDSSPPMVASKRWALLRCQMTPTCQSMKTTESQASASSGGGAVEDRADGREETDDDDDDRVPTLASLEAAAESRTRKALAQATLDCANTDLPTPEAQRTYGALKTGYERNISNPSEPSNATNYQDRNVIDLDSTANTGEILTNDSPKCDETLAGPSSKPADTNSENSRKESSDSSKDSDLSRPGPSSERSVDLGISASVSAKEKSNDDGDSSGPSSSVQAGNVENGDGVELNADAQGLVSQSTQTAQERAGCSRAEEPAPRAAPPAHADYDSDADSDADDVGDAWLGESDILPARFLSTIDSSRLTTPSQRRKQEAALRLEDQCCYLQPALKQTYVGHRNARTMIKEACFWGTDYVMSGSDCGHVFVWDRATARLVALLPGDQHVVNCVQPHPTLPILATSGIDYDVKFWAPLAEEKAFDEEAADNLMKRNAVMLEETKDTITVPASFMIRMLACLNQIRRGGRTRANRRDQAEQ